MDVLYFLLVLVLLSASLGLARLCERLQEKP